MSIAAIKERAKQYKLDCENKLKEMDLQPNYNYMIGTEKEGVFYTITRSLYKKDHIQLTTFIRNDPYSHITYKDINELISDFRNAFFTDKKQLRVIEVIPNK